MWQVFFAALVEELPKLLSGTALLLLAWFVGQRLTNKWNLRQKARELDLAATNEFHALYGEFFAVWKLWNSYRQDDIAGALDGDTRWDLLKRATDAEGRLEAILVRIASTKALRPLDIERLAQFRQVYKSLRKAIRAGKPLDWNYSEHPTYVQFKELAPYIAVLIRRGSGMGLPANAPDALKDITANKWELGAPTSTKM